LAELAGDAAGEAADGDHTSSADDVSPADVGTSASASASGDGGSSDSGLTQAEAATADALESVSGTERVVDAEPSSGGADGGSEGAPFGDEEGVLAGVEVVVDDATMRRALEAILMVTDEPLPALTLARTVGRPAGDVTNALNELAGEYTEQGRGFDLREVGGGWRYYTRADAAQYVERFVLDGQQSRLTQAALETLAVVAYKQPVSRARVSAIRGVNVDGVMRTLISRGLVEEAGADTESQATLYRTTSYFLERMGMQSLDDLPELAPYLPDMDDMEDELAAQNAPTAEAGAGEGAGEGVGQGEVAAQDEAAGGPDAVDREAVVAEESEADMVQGNEAGVVQADEVDVVQEPVAEGDGGESGDGELEPAEELEAGGDELDPEVDPAEILAVEEDAEGNDEDGGDDDEAADVDAADVDAADDAADDGEDVDDFDEDDESADERLEAAEDLELAGAPEEPGDEPVADGAQYGKTEGAQYGTADGAQYETADGAQYGATGGAEYGETVSGGAQYRTEASDRDE
jgi:segregation and condensation protein B